MKLKLTTIFSAIVLFMLMQSCTVPNPYEPVNNGTTTGTTNTTNGGTTNGNAESDDDDDDDDDDNNGTGTTTGGTGTGTTTGGTTTGGTGTGTTTGGTTTGGTGTGTTTGGTTTGGTTTGGTTTGGTTTTNAIALSGSSSGGNKSHNMGKNCMSCHTPGTSAGNKGVWKIGGTAYNSSAGTTTAPNLVVKFYTGPDGTGTLKYTLNVDAKGNFYSANTVDFTGGLYPAVVGATTTKYMGSPISMGACNSCHTGGAGTAKIWAN